MSSANLGSRSLVAIVDTTSMGINENNEYTVMEHDMIPTNVNFNTGIGNCMKMCSKKHI